MGKEDGIETDKFVCPKCGSQVVHRDGSSKEVSIYYWVLGILFAITDVVWSRESPLNYWTILVFVLAIVSSLMEKSQKPPDGKWELKCERCGEKFLIDEPNKKY